MRSSASSSSSEFGGESSGRPPVARCFAALLLLEDDEELELELELLLELYAAPAPCLAFGFAFYLPTTRIPVDYRLPPHFTTALLLFALAFAGDGLGLPAADFLPEPGGRPRGRLAGTSPPFPVPDAVEPRTIVTISIN